MKEIDSGDISGALGSMASDLGKHEETAGHDGIRLGMMLMMSGGLSTAEKMKKFINGFN
ncbi:hypothetical protein LCGC14_0479520 [marine sediment metagenome]|uniref:DhaL domain-containing protein n=1 Tax=marine sediment metagenome TaxID=412755 RepID=A0A0F9UWR7_9ZZZZ